MARPEPRGNEQTSRPVRAKSPLPRHAESNLPQHIRELTLDYLQSHHNRQRARRVDLQAKEARTTEELGQRGLRIMRVGLDKLPEGSPIARLVRGFPAEVAARDKLHKAIAVDRHAAVLRENFIPRLRDRWAFPPRRPPAVPLGRSHSMPSVNPDGPYAARRAHARFRELMGQHADLFNMHVGQLLARARPRLLGGEYGSREPSPISELEQAANRAFGVKQVTVKDAGEDARKEAEKAASRPEMRRSKSVGADPSGKEGRTRRPT